jgi:hypothetical protein
MSEKTATQQIVERVVSQVLEGRVPQLREELVRRVVEQLPAPADGASGGVPTSADGGAALLLNAVATIQAGSTQREILRALLDHLIHYSGRAALFVIKSGTATGWQGRGFAKNDEDPIKDFALDVTAGLAERALQSRRGCSGEASEMDAHFVAQFGAPADGRVLVLPLVLKEKVAALVYADGGAGAGKMEAAALELLVLSAGAWLEVTSLRKHAVKEAAAESEGVEKAESAAPVQPVASPPDPFSAHAPKHAAAAAAGVASATVVAGESHESVEPTPANGDSQTSEEADLQRKAQRFARLLVDEIKLYNQAKVAEGRKHKDLYDRLKEDIEKSRATYKKRYGNTVAANGDYFSQELVRSLAEDDSSIMGANFRR